MSSAIFAGLVSAEQNFVIFQRSDAEHLGICTAADLSKWALKCANAKIVPFYSKDAWKELFSDALETFHNATTNELLSLPDFPTPQSTKKMTKEKE